MCGIAGLLDVGAVPGARADLARRMGDRLAHRGPDDAGVWADDEAGVALAHRRLAILDLTPAGHQPMASACGRHVLTFNGEIYNHLELRTELERAGAAPPWRGHADTETLLAAFSAWGIEATLKKSVGMFALAVWDRDRRTLTLARDRLGEKPLYYGWLRGTFLFASELKALRAWPGFDAEIDRGALALFLRHNCIPAPHTVYRGISKLMPGTALTVAASGERKQPVAYWSVREVAERGLADPFRGDEAEAADELERLLGRSVAGQMVADVPLGAFLSGGIDSSTVVALMRAHAGQPVRTFTIGFAESGYNEAPEAAAVAAHLGTRHTELYVSPAEAMAVIPRLPTLYDEPFADSSQIPTFLVSQLARRQVSVSLSGDGGDELFGGYNRHFWAAQLWRRAGYLPRPLRGILATAVEALSPAAWDGLFARLGRFLPSPLRQRNPGDKLHKLAEVLAARGPEEIYLDLVSHWKSPLEVARAASEPPTLLTDPAALARLENFESRMMYLDMVTYLPDDILTKVDRAAMGVSLETRVPMLDHRVVEFAWRLPLSMKIRGAQGKWLLRQVLHRHVPAALVERPKAGFGLPVGDWLRGPLRDWAEALLDEGRLAREGFFHPRPIRALWTEHLNGRRNAAYHLWDILMFQAWLEEVRRHG
jgi:asparagine synthase (glutamine-hydrolysing)